MREAFEKIRAGLLEALGIAKAKDTERPWLIDREGVTYLPERKVVLKAKQSKLQA